MSATMTQSHCYMRGAESLDAKELIRASIPRPTSESSTICLPEYEMLDLSTNQPVAKVLDFYRHPFLESQICNADKTPLYFSEISFFTPKKPDVTLHRGGDDKGPILAVAKIIRWSKTTKLGLGNTSRGDEDMWWEKMRRKPWNLSIYRWELPIRDDDRDPIQTGERRRFAWKRTHNAEGLTMKWSLWNYKLIDEDTNEVLAVYAANHFKSWKKVGKLIFYRNLGKDWEIMVVLTAAALLEKNRRRCRRGGGGRS